MSNDIVLEPEENIELNVIEPEEVIDLTLDETDEIDFDMDVVTVNTTYHDLLLHRDFPDQHPIEAITGLEDALDGLEDDIDDLEIELGTKQDTLVSGVNIKTVREETLLGPGNVDTDPDAISFLDIYDIVNA